MTDAGGGSLAGQVAIVTGGTRGIGLATARALTEAGATVVVTGRDPDRTAHAAKEIGPNAQGVLLDVSDFDAVGEVFKGIAAEHGRLDVLVANAGLLEDALLGMIRSDLVARIIGTNVNGTLYTLQAAARIMMRKKSGAIVVLGSIVGEQGSAGQTAYAASKAAVATIARSAAKELGPRGIRVNAVAPGLIQTNMIAHLPPDLLARRVEDTSLRRLGAPEDVARVIRFLVSPDAAFVTGQVVGVDGGLVL